MKRLLLLLSLSILTSCVPTNPTVRPRIAVLNAPTELRFPGLADAVAARLEKEVGTTFAFSPPETLRFQETHSDMSGSRALLRTSLIARSQGAAYAVMVGLRGVKTARALMVAPEALEVEVTLTGRVQATLVNPENATELGTFISPEFATRVTKTVAVKLPDGVELDSSVGRSIVRDLVEQVRVETSVKYDASGFAAPLRQVTDAVAAQLASLQASN